MIVPIDFGKPPEEIADGCRQIALAPGQTQWGASLPNKYW